MVCDPPQNNSMFKRAGSGGSSTTDQKGTSVTKVIAEAATAITSAQPSASYPTTGIIFTGQKREVTTEPVNNNVAMWVVPFKHVILCVNIEVMTNCFHHPHMLHDNRDHEQPKKTIHSWNRLILCRKPYRTRKTLISSPRLTKSHTHPTLLC